MDRSRIAITLILVFTFISLILGIVRLGVTSQDTRFSAASDGFLSSGKSGVALIKVHGVIGSGQGGGGANADYITALLRRAGEDASIRGVILDINSPGGAVGATKLIYDEVRKLKKSKYPKPVVAIISDIAASGGYYIASAADKILAYEGSVVGSIGVISMHINLSALLERYGIQVTVIKSGRYKDASYPFRSMTAEELGMRQSMQKDAYNQFIKDVADGRKVRFSDVQTKWAEGRIFSGKQAERERLIDDFGGRDKAMDIIKEALKTDQDLPILEPERNILEEFLGSLLSLSGRSMDAPTSLLNAPILYLYPAAPGLNLELAGRVLQLPVKNQAR